MTRVIIHNYVRGARKTSDAAGGRASSSEGRGEWEARQREELKMLIARSRDPRMGDKERIEYWLLARMRSSRVSRI